MKKMVKKKKSGKGVPATMKLATEREIAMDFAGKVYKKFDQMVKSIILFGSSAKKASVPGSDIDIIVIIDDVSIQWDQELVATYREELSKIIKANPYTKSLHVNSVKLSTWWADLSKGDPIVVNILRYGDALIDHGGFFVPLQVLLKEGKIKSTPESIYTLLQRAPVHMSRARGGMLSAVDGIYWAMVDSAHAALIANNVVPASPEHIGFILQEEFVDKKLLKKKYVEYFEEAHNLAKEIVHGKRIEIEGKKVDELYEKADEFVGEMADLVNDLIEKK